MSFSKSAETRLYREYLDLFRNEIQSVVNRTTPYMISCIISKSLKTKGPSSTIRTKKFPELSVDYLKGVINEMKTKRITATLSNSDCVFFVKDDGTQEADYTRGLIAFHIIADVISAGVIDISHFLPKSYDKTLTEIAGIATNRYKLQCSRSDYVNSMSTELMELVTVMLPKKNKLLQKASRVNAAASPAQSRRITPILFLGSMMALAGGVAADSGAGVSPGNQLAFKAPVGVQETGSVVTRETMSINNSVHTLLDENTVLQKRFDDNIHNAEFSKSSNVDLIKSKMARWFKDFEFSLTPLDGKDLAPEWLIEASKFSAHLAEKADIFARRGGISQAERETVVAEVMGKYLEALRSFDPTFDILLLEGGDYTLFVAAEEIQKSIQGGSAVESEDGSLQEAIPGNLPLNTFLGNVAGGIAGILDEAININIASGYRIKEIDDELLQLEVDDKVAGISTKTTGERVKDLTEEKLSLKAKSVLKLDPRSVEEIMENMRIMSLVMNVVPNKEIVAFSLPCPEGSTCEPVTIVYADPTTSGLVEVARKVVTLQSNIAVSDNPYISVKEIRSTDAVRRHFRGKNNVEVEPFEEYINRANEASSGNKLGVKNEQIEAEDHVAISNVIVTHLAKYQRINSEFLPEEDMENISLLLWNGFKSINPQEIVTVELMIDFLKKMMPNANDMENLLSTLKEVVETKFLDTEDSDVPELFYAEMKAIAPSLVKELIRSKMKENGLDPEIFQDVSACRHEGGNCKFKEFLKSPAAKQKLRILKGQHTIGDSWAFARWISVWRDDGEMEKETLNLLTDLERSLSEYRLKDGEEILLDQKEMDAFLELTRFIALASAGDPVPMGGDTLNAFMLYIDMMIKDWVTSVEVAIGSIAISLTVAYGKRFILGFFKGLVMGGFEAAKLPIKLYNRLTRDEL